MGKANHARTTSAEFTATERVYGMGIRLKTLTIRGFRSIELLEEFYLGRLTVMIGANGSGKSNFVDFFRMLRAIADGGFQQFVKKHGGADGFFFLGPKHTRQIQTHLVFGENAYELDLAPGADGKIYLSDERVQYTGGHGMGKLQSIGMGNSESALIARREESANFGQGKGVPSYVYGALSSWVVYHFHDTSLLAPMRRDQAVRDNTQLRAEADNIAAFLLCLRETNDGRYEVIRDTIRLIAPFFDDFVLNPDNNEKVRLEWRQKGSDFPFQPSQFSDGTMRFICLATALQQPTPPATIVIDEPELGLHPYAISVLAEMIKSASMCTQVIVATQSPTLLDHFEPENVVVAQRHDGRSVFTRLEPSDLTEWLQEYSVGELWQKNVIQGGACHE